ncbi:MAG: LysR family transcriptional regulator [Pseudomonas sp.]
MSEMDDLAAFATLVEVGSFTGAAARLGCSKGQLSKRIGLLEQGLGVGLLYRTTRKLSLTAAGAALLPEAQALLAQAARARQTLARLQEEASGVVRITAPVSLGDTIVAALQPEFAQAYPEIRIELELSNSYRDLLADGFDLAIRSGEQSDQRLVARPLLSMQELTCASPAYLAAHGEVVTPEQLSAHICLLNSHYSGAEEWLYHRQHALTRVQVKGPFASNHYSLLKKACLGGAGIARLPSYLVHQELLDGSLVWLLHDYQTRISPVFLVHAYPQGLPRRTQVVADYLAAWFERRRQELDRLVAL